MRPKSMVLILIALFCGLIASIGISQVVERQGKDDTQQVKTVKIFVASADVDMAEELTAQNVKMEDWPANKVPEGAVKDLEQLMGRRPRLRLFAGDPITAKKLLDPNARGTGSEQIPRGYRVMSVKVSMSTAVSYLIKPGDRVDVLVFHKGGYGNRSRTTTLMKNVTVFAVNSKVTREMDEDGTAIHAKTISMLVKPAEVEKLAHAEETGRIRLSLRRPDEEVAEDDSETGGFSLDTEVAQPTTPPAGLANMLSAVAEAAAPPAFEMKVISGNVVKNYTWNDVTELPNELQPKEPVTTQPPVTGLPIPVGLTLPGQANELDVNQLPRGEGPVGPRLESYDADDAPPGNAGDSDL